MMLTMLSPATTTLRAVKLIASKIADAVLEGKQGEQMTDAAVDATIDNDAADEADNF